MRPITLQRLQVFCAVYENDSISAAARSLRLSQPTVSRHLRDFEAALGLSLFVLDKGRVMPTAEADAIYGESRFLFDGVTRLENRIEALRQGEGQTLSLMTVNMLTPHFVPRAVAHALEALPGLAMTLDVGTLAQQLAALRAGQVDLCIVAGRVQAEDVRLERLGQGRLRLLVPPGSPLAGPGPVPVEDLSGVTLLGSTLRGPVGKVLAQALAGYDVDFSAQVTVNSLSLVPPLCQALETASLADEFTIHFQNTSGFEVLDLAPEVIFDIYAMTLGPVQAGSAARIFLRDVRRLLADWEAGDRPAPGG